MPHLFGDCSNYYRYVVQRFKNAARNDKWDFFKICCCCCCRPFAYFSLELVFSYSRRWFLFSCSLSMRSKGGQRSKREKQQMAAPGCGIGAVRAQGKWEPSWAKVFWRLFAFRPSPILLDCFLFVGLGFFPSVFFYSLLEKKNSRGGKLLRQVILYWFSRR